MKHWICSFFIMIFSVAVQGQVTLEAKLDSSHILIGDQTKLHLKLTQNPNWKVVFPQQIQLGDSIEILDASLFDTVATSPNLIIKKDLTITSFDSGVVRIPPIPIQYSSLDSSNYQTTFSKPVFLNVAMVAVSDTTVLKPIKAILNEPATWEDYVGYLIGIGTVLLIGFLFWYLIKRGSKQVEEEVAPPPPRPAHEIALEQLNLLKKEELWQKGEVKTYQSRLTDIIRAYIEKRYQVPAMESTTFEIIGHLKDKDISTELKTKIREMLEVADLVKFAKATPPHNIHEKLMDDAVNFVTNTKELIVPEVQIRREA